ncbi:tRNA modification GTPase [Desulfatibacillum alkenivorans DSM 16219]|uniref:tRNA modification GTPase MnmE n=1 Tax=Desulfatibacillum alkenivorans DSM 16219 TaxID=1121393 RepID=A0A1M6SBQ8_9BACT|nr:tRNA uridine-5-carboxymethylaminomethyl(34) synthesis GTPase MnmE [Desulfatibacillum alkenivorans]SHK42204.1 tRNA modification GTPase [Desulfatibacillum alkenivorans DSM 16219]
MFDAMNLSQTIAAIATPPGVGGIGVIRISGSLSSSILKSIFQPAHSSLFDIWPPQAYKLIRGKIVDPQTSAVKDDVLAVFMPGPGTYTGEDVVEIQGHGGPVVLGAVLETVLSQGARLAEPGEFTRRAFLNGRMDLSQAEAVVDLIHARTSQAAKTAATHVGGGLKNQVKGILESIMECRAHVEAALDFSEDAGDGETESILAKLDQGVIPPLRELAEAAELGKAYMEGLKAAIVGRPNVGKSSLMNALAGQERSIVTETPGATRDVVREPVLIRGLHFTLSDTAGMRTSSDAVEMIGIQRAKDAMGESDLIILVVEAGSDLSPEDQELLRQAERSCNRVLMVYNKLDLHPGFNPSPLGDYTPVAVSAKTGQGLEGLRQAMEKALRQGRELDAAPGIIPNLRQKGALEDALQSAAHARDRILEEAWELAAFDMEEAQKSLEQILGIGVSPDILDRIFSYFCIGK